MKDNRSIVLSTAAFIALSLIATAGPTYAGDSGSKISQTDSEIIQTRCEDQGCRMRKLAAARRALARAAQKGGCNELCQSKCDHQPSCIAEWGPRNLVRLESFVTTMNGRVQKRSADGSQ